MLLFPKRLVGTTHDIAVGSRSHRVDACEEVQQAQRSTLP